MNNLEIAKQIIKIARTIADREIVAGNTEQRELYLYISNDSTIYRRNIVPTIKNIKKRIDNGTYDPQRAIKLWMYTVDAGANQYHKEFGSPEDKWSDIFTKQDRIAVAKELRDEYQKEIEDGQW